MFDSKSPIVKYTGYAIITFFCAIIIIAFGMPTFLPQITNDKSTVAVINGEKIRINDFLRYRDSRNRNMKTEDEQDKALTEYIQARLLLQKAKDIGFDASDSRVTKTLKEYPFLRDPESGKFDPKRFSTFLENNYLTLDKFYLLHKNDFIKQDFIQYVMMGLTTSSDDIKTEYMCNNSKIQVKYSFLANEDLRKKHSSRLNVTDKEVTEEMDKNKKEIKDPKTDRARIKRKLENDKFKKLQKEIVDRVNEIALNKGSFSEASRALNGKTALSNEFNIGGMVKENAPKGKPLTSLSNSKVFLEECLSIPEGNSSRAIETATGIYVFTPVLKKINNENPPEKDLETLKKGSEYQSFNTIYSNIMAKFYEESKITKNLKTN